MSRSDRSFLYSMNRSTQSALEIYTGYYDSDEDDEYEDVIYEQIIIPENGKDSKEPCERAHDVTLPHAHKKSLKGGKSC